LGTKESNTLTLLKKKKTMGPFGYAVSPHGLQDVFGIPMSFAIFGLG
jgi:hypothetical protein